MSEDQKTEQSLNQKKEQKNQALEDKTEVENNPSADNFKSQIKDIQNQLLASKNNLITQLNNFVSNIEKNYDDFIQKIQKDSEDLIGKNKKSKIICDGYISFLNKKITSNENFQKNILNENELLSHFILDSIKEKKYFQSKKIKNKFKNRHIII